MLYKTWVGIALGLVVLVGLACGTGGAAPNEQPQALHASLGRAAAHAFAGAVDGEYHGVELTYGGVGASARQRLDVIRAQQARDAWAFSFGWKGEELRPKRTALPLAVGVAKAGVWLRATDASQPELSMRLVSLGRVHAMRQLPLPERIALEGGRAVMHHRMALSEWWQSGSLGLEQGIDIAKRPAGTEVGAPLVVRMELSGGRAESDGHGGVRLFGLGQAVLRYTDLFAEDAGGKLLPTRMVARDRFVDLVIDDANAVYPLHVDPLVWIDTVKLVAGDAQAGDEFGYSVSLSGERALVGANLESSVAANAGAAYVFERGSNFLWTQVKITASDGAADDNFGYSVSLDGDWAVVGAKDHDGLAGLDSGAVYAYQRDSNGQWIEKQKLVPGDSEAGDNWGYAVAVAGTQLLVGAPGDDDKGSGSGSVYVFALDATDVWVEKQKLTAADGVGGDTFGSAVAIGHGRAIVGSKLDDDLGVSSGSAYIFARDPFGVWVERQKLLPSDGAAGEAFGYAVGLSQGHAIVGARYDADLGTSSGSAYVFEVDGNGQWSEATKLLASDGEAFDHFGQTVAIEGDRAVVGAYADDDKGSASGSAYVFARDNSGQWSESQKLQASDGTTADYFGWSVAVGGGRIAVAARYEDDGGTNAGAAYIFDALASTGDPCTSAAECASAFCVDGVCCDSFCGGGDAGDCEACSVAAGATTDGICDLRAASSTCRPSAGACDEVEFCDGMSPVCPVDAKAAANTPCRASAGLCDAGEVCDGLSDACPADAKVAANTVCRAAAGACDVAELCDGQSDGCPVDARVPAGLICRPSAGICDSAEACDGMAAACPVDAKVVVGSPCRASAGSCDVAESCDGVNDGCPADAKVAANTECRAAAGACDVAESCNGVNDGCPADAKVAANTECRAAAGACDVAESCDGQSDSCPVDAKVAANTECRAVAGACDVAESCDGQSGFCPLDQKVPAGLLCRASAGACDVAEACDGLGSACPEDAKASDGSDCGLAGGTCQMGKCFEPEGSGGAGGSGTSAGSGGDAAGSGGADASNTAGGAKDGRANADGGCGCRLVGEPAVPSPKHRNVWLLLGTAVLLRRRRGVSI